MHCIGCGKEIPDDARFCMACGRPQRAPKSPDPVAVERCQIEWRLLRRSQLLSPGAEAKFVAMAWGPEGKYVVAESRVFDQAGNDPPRIRKFAESDRHGTPMREALSELESVLLRDGWELEGKAGDQFYSQQYRRALKDKVGERCRTGWRIVKAPSLSRAGEAVFVAMSEIAGSEVTIAESPKFSVLSRDRLPKPIDSEAYEQMQNAFLKLEASLVADGWELLGSFGADEYSLLFDRDRSDLRFETCHTTWEIVKAPSFFSVGSATFVAVGHRPNGETIFGRSPTFPLLRADSLPEQGFHEEQSAMFEALRKLEATLAADGWAAVRTTSNDDTMRLFRREIRDEQ